jgi:hypothetical protein
MTPKSASSAATIDVHVVVVQVWFAVNCLQSAVPVVKKHTAERQMGRRRESRAIKSIPKKASVLKESLA